VLSAESEFEVEVEVEVEVNLRPTVSCKVCLGVRRPSGTRDQFFFLLEISFRQVCVCYFVAPSLTRGRDCNLLYNCFWALPEQSLLGRSSAELTTIFYWLIWDSPKPRGPGSRIYIPQEQGVPVIPPGTGFPLCRLLRLSGQRWRYSNRGCVCFRLVPYDAVNRNKVSIRQIPLYFSSHLLHVSAPTGHLQVRYTIRCF
jgi:hypothetical protein